MKTAKDLVGWVKDYANGRCCYEVAVHPGFRFAQCSRRGVEEVGGLPFCKQHAKMVEAMLGRMSEEYDMSEEYHKAMEPGTHCM